MSTATTPEFKKLAVKYPYIVAWGKLMGSFGYYILAQMEKAEKDNAPSDAIYRNTDSTWSIYSACRPELKIDLDAYKAGKKGGAIIN